MTDEQFKEFLSRIIHVIQGEGTVQDAMKGYSVLISALAQLHETHPKFAEVFAGWFMVSITGGGFGDGNSLPY